MIGWLWRWGPVLAHMALIFAASSMTAVPDLPGGLSDKAGHLLAYALLGVLALRAFAGAAWRGVSWVSAVRALLLSAAYGATDEVHQLFVVNRTADVRDWFADVTGAAIGAFLVLAMTRAARRRGV